MAGKIELDLTSGNLFKKLIIIAVPLMFTQILQLLFNTADTFVLGIFVEPIERANNAVAAVGSTSALINLIIGLFTGISTGVNVLVGQYIGRQDKARVQKIIGTSMLVSLIGGGILLIIGVCFSKTFLIWMGSDLEVLPMATTYMQIYFCGMPIMLLYNFCASILRAAGDTKRPLIFLAIGGVVNVGLNVFFVTVLKKDVEGVAVATVVSQAISAVLCVIVLLRASGVVKLNFKNLRIYGEELKEMFKIGLPSGIQGCLFSFSNVILQSTVNSFGNLAMAGSAYCVQVESYVFAPMNSVALANMSFVSQNYGAGKISNVKGIIKNSAWVVFVMGLVLGTLVTLLIKPILMLITTEQAVIAYAFSRMLVVGVSYFLCGLMDVFSYSLRGLGKSFSAMIVSLCGACLLRIVWLEFLYPAWNTYEMIFISFPVTWFITSFVLAIMLSQTIKKSKRDFSQTQALGNQTCIK